jgi:UDP-N-acetylmuramate--alanine ligase
MVEDNNQLAKYLKHNISGKKIVIGMGAGSISNWIKQLPDLMK